MVFRAAPRNDFQLSDQFLDCLFAQFAAFHRVNNDASTDHLHAVLINWFFFENTTDIHALALESLEGRYVAVEQISLAPRSERPIRSSTERVFYICRSAAMIGGEDNAGQFNHGLLRDGLAETKMPSPENQGTEQKAGREVFSGHTVRSSARLWSIASRRLRNDVHVILAITGSGCELYFGTQHTMMRR